MRTALRALFAVGLGFAVSVLLATCGGGSGLLSGAESSSLSAQLAAVSSAVNARHCEAARTAITNFSNLVAELPPSVGPTLRRNLDQGASTVGRLAAHDCQLPATTATPSQPNATTRTTPTRTTSSSTTSSTTTSTATSTTSTPAPTSSTTTPTTPTTSTTSTTTPATRTTPTGTTSTPSSGGAGLGKGGGNGQ